MRTLYSGYDNPGVAFKFLSEAFRRRDMQCGKFVSVHAADISPSRRQVLLGWEDSDSGAQHIFGDICDRLPSDTRARIRDMMPDYNKIRQSHRSAVQHGMILDAADKYKHIAELLENTHREAFTAETTAHCYKHGTQCKCSTFESDAGDSAMTWVVAGSNCQAWSQRGLQLGVAHPSFLVWLTFIFELKRMGPDNWLHENTPYFPGRLFSHILGSKYHIVIFNDVCPSLLGHPVRRPRQYIADFRRGAVESIATEQEFKQLFGRRVVVLGTVYWVAPNSEAIGGASPSLPPP